MGGRVCYHHGRLNTDGIWLRRAAIRVSHRILHNLLCLMTFQMTIWMCRRHDDFRSAAPIVEIAMQLHVTSAPEKVAGIIPQSKSGGPIPLSPPPAPTPMSLARLVRSCHARRHNDLQ